MVGTHGGERIEPSRRQNDRRDCRLRVNRACLLSNLFELSGIRDRLRASVHVAQTARREAYSCLVTGLEVPKRANVKNENERQPPQERRTDENQEARDHNARNKRGNPEDEPLAPASP